MARNKENGWLLSSENPLMVVLMIQMPSGTLSVSVDSRQMLSQTAWICLFVSVVCISIIPLHSVRLKDWRFSEKKFSVLKAASIRLRLLKKKKKNMKKQVLRVGLQLNLNIGRAWMDLKINTSLKTKTN